MRVNVVTTWEPGFPGAERFVSSFTRNFPLCQGMLHVFTESAPCPHGAWAPYPHNLDDDADRAAFLRAAPQDGADYRQAARRFCHKVFAYTSPLVRDCDVLIWLDADTETTAPITSEWLERVGPGDTLCSYLGRDHYEHSETGFLAFKMPDAAVLLDRIRALYTSKQILFARGRTDAHAFDIARRGLEREGKTFRNLSAGCTGLHVWPQTDLALCLDHHKGPRRKAEAYGALNAAV